MVTQELKKLHVIAGTKVQVKWDQDPDIEGCKESTIGEQSLLPSRWNKDNKEGARRMDVDIEVRDELDDDNDDQDKVGRVRLLVHLILMVILRKAFILYMKVSQCMTQSLTTK